MNIFHNLQGLNLLEGFFVSTPFLISYAEIHYHFRYLFPRYFRKEPEIITDIPLRVIKNQKRTIPLLLIVKDADLFPVMINSINICIEGKNKTIIKKFIIEKKIEAKYYSQILNVNAVELEVDQYLKIIAKIDVDIAGKSKIITNDNFPDIPVKPYKIFYSKESLPMPDNWFAGEPHYHSIHTSDQVEFGADIRSSVELAKAMGLNWLFVTDHSYDLDDALNSYTINDPDLPIWKKMHEDVQKCDSKGFRVIPGEEVSIGNSKDENVHMLAINHHDFIAGKGDSAEKWFRNKPTHQVNEISQLHNDDNLFIAAHPFEKVPFLQKLTLRRGSWSKEDCDGSEVKYLQVINSSELREIDRSIKAWRDFLLKGSKYYLIAGNDAHGNFNVMRQIKSPFLKLFSSQKQVFGQFYTAFKYHMNDPVAGLKNGEVIVSNGPFLSFILMDGNDVFPIGSVCKATNAELIFEYRTSTEFGKITNIYIHIGNCQTNKELEITDPVDNIELILPEKGYVRMSLKTKNGGITFTNPIWID